MSQSHDFTFQLRSDLAGTHMSEMIYACYRIIHLGQVSLESVSLLSQIGNFLIKLIHLAASIFCFHSFLKG